MTGLQDIARSRSIAAKIAITIVVVAAAGVALLAARQRRLSASHDIASLHLRAEEDARTVLRLRQEIADRLSLSHLRELAAANGMSGSAFPLGENSVSVGEMTEPQQSASSVGRASLPSAGARRFDVRAFKATDGIVPKNLRSKEITE